MGGAPEPLRPSMASGEGPVGSVERIGEAGAVPT